MEGGLLVAFFVEGWPIAYARVEETDVHVVEMVQWVGPLAAGIVYFKGEVGRDRATLAG